MFDEAIDLVKSTDGQPSGVDKAAGDESFISPKSNMHVQALSSQLNGYIA
jgi:hypothetical protein